MSQKKNETKKEPKTKEICAAIDCENTGTKKCSGCLVARYCSSDCQKTHWNDHKRECKTLQKKNVDSK